jgi:hypothetical protein
VESRDVSPISPWAELPKKETEEWIRLRDINWKEEAKGLIETFKWWKKCTGELWMAREERGEWRLQHLEIPFISYPTRDDPYDSIKNRPWNQEAIQEMIKVNPVLKDPEGAASRKQERLRRWQEERRSTEEVRLHAIQQRQWEEPAQALVQNQRPVFVEQNLGQWIREIEDDERRRMESPTERRTREWLEQIQADRRYLERDGRFQEIIEDVRRLPNGPERQEVFGRFWVNLFTQEYQK